MGASLPAGTIMAWDLARGEKLDPPVYAEVRADGRAHVIISVCDYLPVGCDLPDYIYTDLGTRSIARNREVPMDEWPPEVCAYMAQRALLGELE